jgi:hypothetical protein
VTELPPPPEAAGASSFADALADRIERNVLAVAAVVRAVAIAGLAAGGAIWLALAPWVLRLPGGTAVVVLLVLLLPVVVPPVALLRHRHDLCEAYGDSELLEDQVALLGGSATDAYHRLRTIEAAKPEGKLGLVRWSWSYLRHVRTIWKSGFGDQFRRLADPIEPTRLARSASFGLWSVATCVASVPVVAVSLLALAVAG